jgi:ubiquinone/menaquinone biosynthesis C-methylase UbiE
MSIAKYLSAQLRQPSGAFGRYVMLRLLNRLNTPINALTLAVLQLKPNDRVLEVGFGGGDLMAKMTLVLTRGHVTGVDFSPDAVSAGTKRYASLIESGKVELHCANVDALPFKSDMFTKACTVNTIYFWPDPLRAMVQLRTVLIEGGTLVVSFSPKEILEKRKPALYGFRLYEPDEVSDLFRSAGFRDVRLVFGKGKLGDCVVAAGTK